MKTIFRIFGYGLVLVAGIAVGYVVGSMRGAEVAGFYRQTHHMYTAYLVAKTIREGRADEVYRYAHSISWTYHRNVADSPLMSSDLLIPVFMSDETKWYPVPFFGVDAATKGWVTQVGQFLSETNEQSNKVTSANGATPRR